MRRRRFIQSTPAMAVAVPAIAQQPSGPRSDTLPEPPAKLATVGAEAAAEPVQRFFTASQFATLKSLCNLMMPPIGKSPGALDAGVPIFLDFLLDASPAERQRLYRQGLDHIDAAAKRKFGKAFPEIDATAAGKILEPLIVQWTYDPPTDPYQRFMTEVRADIRAATMNSREWSLANASTGRRRGGGGGFYWNPIDPTRPR